MNCVIQRKLALATSKRSSEAISEESLKPPHFSVLTAISQNLSYLLSF